MRRFLFLVALLVGFYSVPARAQNVACNVKSDGTTVTSCVNQTTYGVHVTATTATGAFLNADANRSTISIQSNPSSASNVCVAFGNLADCSNTPPNCFWIAAGNGLTLWNAGPGGESRHVYNTQISACVASGSADITFGYTQQ